MTNSGFLLNYEMDDFSSKPGSPNTYGLIGSQANSIEPGKRMLSSMTPSIILKNNKPSLIVGTPGGSTIITSVLQTILNVYEFDMSIQEAVNAARFHHQWLPDVVIFEEGIIDKVKDSILKSKSYYVISLPIEVDTGGMSARSSIGAVDAILIDRGDLTREISIMDIPFAQRSIIKVANNNSTPCYIATNVLESLIKGDIPTRAELNDIVGTLEMGATGIVLAAETAIGKHPEDSIINLKKIISLSTQKKIKF